MNKKLSNSIVKAKNWMDRHHYEIFLIGSSVVVGLVGGFALVKFIDGCRFYEVTIGNMVTGENQVYYMTKDNYVKFLESSVKLLSDKVAAIEK